MKRQILLLAMLLSLPAFIISCKKDKLTGIYDRFEGKYEWAYSYYTFRDCSLCPLKSHTDFASQANYTAQIEFDNTTHITFFINNEVLVKKKFKIKDQYQDGNTLFMDLKVDVNKDVLDIDDKIEVYSISEDTIYILGFPGSGYDNNFQGSNYFVRVN